MFQTSFLHMGSTLSELSWVYIIGYKDDIDEGDGTIFLY